jgi:hypothetical protein
MKELNINIKVKFGSRFQEICGRDTLMASLKSWVSFVQWANKKNLVKVEIDGNNLKYLDWFDFKKVK